MTRPLALALGLCACIGDPEVKQALDSYCALDELKACDEAAAQTGCCPGHLCVRAVCRTLTPGTCLLPHEPEAQGAGAACGCAADCRSRQCLADSTCK